MGTSTRQKRKLEDKPEDSDEKEQKKLKIDSEDEEVSVINCVRNYIGKNDYIGLASSLDGQYLFDNFYKGAQSKKKAQLKVDELQKVFGMIVSHMGKQQSRIIELTTQLDNQKEISKLQTKNLARMSECRFGGKAAPSERSACTARGTNWKKPSVLHSFNKVLAAPSVQDFKEDSKKSHSDSALRM